MDKYLFIYLFIWWGQRDKHGNLNNIKGQGQRARAQEAQYVCFAFPVFLVASLADTLYKLALTFMQISPSSTFVGPLSLSLSISPELLFVRPFYLVFPVSGIRSLFSAFWFYLDLCPAPDLVQGERVGFINFVSIFLLSGRRGDTRVFSGSKRGFSPFSIDLSLSSFEGEAGASASAAFKAPTFTALSTKNPNPIFFFIF